MKRFRYISGVTTLVLDAERCIGCRLCVTVCPQAVFRMEEKKVTIADLDSCMECGACSLNCPEQALQVHPGTGCAALIISQWLSRVGIKTAGCC